MRAGVIEEAGAKEEVSVIDRAHLLRNAGDLDGAIRALYAALGDDLQNVRVMSHLAPMLAEAGRVDESERTYRRAMRLDPQSDWLRVNFASFLGQTERLDQAEEVLVDVTSGLRERGPVALWVHALNTWGVLEMQRDRPEAALERVRPALTTPSGWEMAEDLAWEAAVALDKEPFPFAMEHLAAGCASPGMVEFVLEQLRECGLWELSLHAFGQADRALFTRWMSCGDIASELEAIYEHWRLRDVPAEFEDEFTIIEALHIAFDFED